MAHANNDNESIQYLAIYCTYTAVVELWNLFFFFSGEYFLAELIESQDSSHQTIVAEVEGRAVGFMSISSEVDVEFLNECYQLEPFHGLKQPLDTDEVQTISTEG